MESAGAGAAVRFRQTMGVLRFLMIKGISDQPRKGLASRANSGSAQRAQWTRYAAAASAALVRGLIEEMVPDVASHHLAQLAQFGGRFHVFVRGAVSQVK